MTKKVTSADVARAAGVSKWTVIRAFDPAAPIAEMTRTKVLAAAAQLDYRPNLLARSLATQRTHLVAILVDDFENPYKLPTLAHLTAALQREGMLGILININDSFDHFAAITDARSRQVDAIVLFGTVFRPEIVARAGSTPCFVLARESTIPGVTSVYTDPVPAMRALGEHLHGRGVRRPAFLRGPRTQSTALGRCREFVSFWAEQGVQVPVINAGVYDRESAAEAVHRWLPTVPGVPGCDALACENDILALGALDALRYRLGLRVPQDIAVVGFDDIDLAAAPSFDLTTYRQPFRDMVEALVQMLTGKRPAETLRLTGDLVLRGSS
ncbi:LacI family DNA-binding transcriptional regulator [Rubellimicrobium arenae]|uniref:LacI family DNA-binding transcriptional regulator n=1 Tax=Rubellimicrobium arenae TaxID=2817372 RepID=UPI001B30FBAE|nr:LacI family DNA-binding transcriptional regulator [Rubellimicrobium arenae]